MLIRSQDKTIIVNIDNAFSIAIQDINGATTIYVGSQGSCCIIAEYSTKTKVMKVLEMIQKRYEEYETERIYREGAFEIGTFQMPEDGSVEV